MNMQNIRIKLKAYDHRLLDQVVKEIVDTVSAFTRFLNDFEGAIS